LQFLDYLYYLSHLYYLLFYYFQNLLDRPAIKLEKKI
jgi:hypothetical protein